jgi:hypothetical protein
MTTILSEHKLTLARDLLDDVELSRLPAEQLLLKASRLARLLEDTDTQHWLQWELNGYPDTNAARLWMQHFGRFTNEQDGIGYWVPLAGVSGTIAAMQVQIQSLQVPHVQYSPTSSNPNEYVTGMAGSNIAKATEPAKGVLDRLQHLTSAIQALTSIRSRVMASVHSFAVGVYHKLAFSGLAESIFETHKALIDRLLQDHAPDVLEKAPAAYDRLSEGDAEAVSQAMNTIRRMIKALADTIYPPSDLPREIEGQKYEIGQDKVLNRIKLYLQDKCPSKSRADRLNRMVRDIHDRASAGAHSDITADEARALFLGAYMALGDILIATSQVEAA